MGPSILQRLQAKIVAVFCCCLAAVSLVAFAEPAQADQEYEAAIPVAENGLQSAQTQNDDSTPAVKKLTLSTDALKVDEGVFVSLPTVYAEFEVAGDSIQGSAGSSAVAATWTSDNEAIARISGNRVSGLSKGAVVLTAHYGGVSASLTVRVQRPMAKTTAAFAVTSIRYDGKAKNPKLVVRDGASVLAPGRDYTVSAFTLNGMAVASGKLPTYPGTYKVIITGQGDYSGTREAQFAITAISLSKAKVTLSKTSYTYDSKAKKPAVTVKLGSKLLKKGRDYSVAYSGNIDAGRAKVTISGIGGYAGTLTKGFTIGKASLAKAKLQLSKSIYTYDGQPKKPAVKLKVGTRSLISGKDFTVKYRSNKNAGTAMAVVTAKGNYKGSVAKSFTIKKASVAKASLKLSQASYIYNGKARKPSVSVQAAGLVLKRNVDYTVEYTKNTNAGKARLVISGKGNYTGKASRSFTIQRASIEDGTVALSATRLQYNGSAQKPAAAVKVAGRQLVEGRDYTIKYTNNRKVGTARATICGIGNYKGSVSRQFKITVASLRSAQVTLSATSYWYDGNAKYPKVTVKLDGRTLKKGRDYTVEYEDNEDIGTATVTVYGEGNYKGSKSAYFTINEWVPPSNYVMNVNSSVFHYDWCSSVSRMNESNKAYTTDRSVATSRGFRPCARCNP